VYLERDLVAAGQGAAGALWTGGPVMAGPGRLRPGQQPVVPEARRCRALAVSTGERCRSAAIRGGVVCTAHGGKAPQVRDAARRRLLEQDAAATLEALGYKPVTDPLTELLELAGRVRALEALFARKVAAIEDQMRYSSGLGVEQLRSEVRLWSEAQDRLGRLLVDIGRLNIEDRLVAVSEHQADTMRAALIAVLYHLGLGNRVDEVRPLLAAELRRLDAQPRALPPGPTP
jgi:hypothetical protein